uniref:ATP synthase subunit b, sodium ion specific n=1 Tax=Ilyobacter tartaricus TaxID=167644 RepID=ATPF_ILYTA|nr:RecName: Full=ATP synthase subunit b, sodium ion specific; AltName: Full=ATP synthase F(0) sector subunit b; AltName: Full=ATPase subunit I; AltName: Full=F-type ATPase subunit b; Short=F-ATPase subunit b [Ilyobacter tartaricus]AAM94909.1 subunit b [Ilyobacter tartaricus]
MAPQNMPAVSIDINMFWQIINFLILMFFFKKYFQKPISKVLDARKEKIANELKQAEIDREMAAKANEETQGILKAARTEANEILLRAEKKADDRKEAILKEANSQREKTIKSAELEVEKMKKQARKELQSEVTALAVNLAEKMINEKLDSKLGANLLNVLLKR